MQSSGMLNLTMKGLSEQSLDSLSALGTDLKKAFGIGLPSPSDLRTAGECTITVRAESLSAFASVLTRADIPIVVRSCELKDSDFVAFFEKYSQGVMNSLHGLNCSDLQDLANDLLAARKARRTIYIFGNGGSASTASHFANDFGKDRFKRSDMLFKIVCLNDSIPRMTALSNDEGYHRVFSGQLDNMIEADDVVIAISSSGNSQNIIEGLEIANKRGAKTWGWVGFDGGDLKRVSQRHVYIPSKKGQYGYMEDVSLVLTHMLCVFIEEHDRRLIESAGR